MATFGQLVRDARRRAKRTLQDAARVLNVSVVYVSEVELGKRPAFSTDRIEKLAVYYHTDAAPLLEAALRERGYLEIDMESSSDWQVKAVSGLARGGLSEEQWQRIYKVIDPGADE